MVTSLEKWQAVVQSPFLVQFFANTFERLGVRVTDTQGAPLRTPMSRMPLATSK